MPLFPTLESLLTKNLATGSTLQQVVVALRSLVKTFSGSFTLKATDFNDQVVIEKDAASGFNPALTVKNDNAGASASASIRVETSGGGSGDPFLIFTNGTTTWAVGLDNSATDNFVIARSAALGGTDAVRIDAATNDLIAAGKLLLYAGGGQTVTITHAATAARTVTLQDLDGSVALLGITPTAPPNAGDLLWADNLYDIGRLLPTPLRPRDLYLARNAAVGGTLSLVGLATLTGGFAAGAPSSVTGLLTVTGPLTVTGTASVNGAPIAAAPLFAAANADLTLTNAYVAVPGCVVTALATALGNWLVEGTFDFRNTVTGDQGQLLLGRLVVGAGATVVGGANSLAISGVPTASSGTLVGMRATVSQTWLVSVTSGTPTFSLEAEKTGGTGTSIVGLNHSAICATYLGRP